MSAQANHWKIGLFVAGTVVLGIATLLWVGSQRLARETLRIHAYFDESVQGLELGSPAKMRGVTVGTVAAIGFASDRRHVDVEIDFYLDVLERLGLKSEGEQDREIDPDLRIQLGTSGITGTKYLAIDYFDSEKFPLADLPFVPSPFHMPTMPSTLKSIEDGITALTEAMPRIVDTAERLGDRLITTVEDMRIDELSARILSLLDQIDASLAALDFEQLQQHTQSLFSESEATLRSAREILEGVEGRQGTVAEALQAWTSLARAASDSLEAVDLPVLASAVRDATSSYEGLAVEATSLTTELHQDLATLRSSMRALRGLLEYLERNPSSLLRGRRTPEDKR